MSMGSGIASLAAVMVAALALAQGGFYPTAVGIAGAVSLLAAGALALGGRSAAPVWRVARRRAWLLPLAFGIIAALCAASALVHGWTIEAAGVVLCWLSLAAFATFCLFAPAEEKARALDGLGWFSVVTAAAGCLAISGVLPPDGVMAAGRLCILFEYSNATGLWFGMAALLMVASRSDRLRAMTPLVLFALFATKSVGALAVVFLAVAAALVLFLKKGQVVRALTLSLSWVGALAAFAVSLAAPLGGVCCAVLACAALGALSPLLAGGRPRRRSEKRPRAKAAGKGGRSAQADSALTCQRAAGGFSVAAMVLTVAAAAAVLAFEPARWVEAQGTFAERLVQMQDGCKLLSANVLLGIGPEQWAQLYPTVQTSEYTSAVNHCSYLQMALDGGVLVPLLYGAAMGAAVVSSARNGQWVCALAAAALLVHSALDFDLHFFALQFLAVFLLSGSGEKKL